jgi:hypothetical protein
MSEGRNRHSGTGSLCLVRREERCVDFRVRWRVVLVKEKGNRPMSRYLEQILSSASIDAEYTFGRPKLYLAPKELARLTILRSKLGDTRAERAAERLPAPASTRPS